MAIIGHPDGFRLVRPRNGDEHRSEDFLSRETPIVGAIGEDGGHGEIALGERSGRGRHAARDKVHFRPFEALLDIAADLLELPLVNDRAHISRFVQGIADFECGKASHQLVEEGVKDASVEEEARTGRA
jgi:hypothetical protein